MHTLKLSLVFAITLCGLINAQRTPSISYITQEQIKDIGGSVELQCSVQYASDYNVVWIKQGGDRFDSVFISNSASLVLKDSRFALRYDVSSSTYTLQIKDLQETDAGKYECQVILSVTNKIRASVDVQVRRPPIISDNSTQSIVASEGRSVQMECYAGGYPQPTITWRRENNAILPTGNYTYNSFDYPPQHILATTVQPVSPSMYETKAQVPTTTTCWTDGRMDSRLL